MKFKNITTVTLMLLLGSIVHGQCIQDCVGDTTRFGQAAGLRNTAKQVSIFGRSAGLENEGEFNSFYSGIVSILARRERSE